VSGVQNIQPLKELLVTVTENDFELKILNGDQVKIQPSSTDKCHTIIKALAEKHTEFHMYQPKKNRSFRTVLRGIHYSTDTNKIKSEIENLATRASTFSTSNKPGPTSRCPYSSSTSNLATIIRKSIE